jgi:hypothetical protein
MLIREPAGQGVRYGGLFEKKAKSEMGCVIGMVKCFVVGQSSQVRQGIGDTVKTVSRGLAGVKRKAASNKKTSLDHSVLNGRNGANCWLVYSLSVCACEGVG